MGKRDQSALKSLFDEIGNVDTPPQITESSSPDTAKAVHPLPLRPKLQALPDNTGDVLQDTVNAIEQRLQRGDSYDRVTFLLKKDLNERLNALCRSKPHGFKSQIFNSVIELILTQYEKSDTTYSQS